MLKTIHRSSTPGFGAWVERLASGGTVADWIYILNPHRDVLDEEPCDKEKILGLAQEDPEAEFWLSRRNRMNRGDRIWFYFTSPDAAVAAVGEVDDEPRVDPDDPDVSYLVAVNLLPVPGGRESATRGDEGSVPRPGGT
jgi:hypothetical protein